jgi:hypothetical protein
MVRRAVLCLLPLVAYAQIPAPQPPPDVDQALRARVNEFFQDFVNSKFRDAMNLVAEDTQDEYLASAKLPIKDFEIREVKYSADFSKADVTLQIKRLWVLPAAALGPGGPDKNQLVVDVPMSTTWKIEKGKWVWTHEIKQDTWLTPMGASNVELVRRNSDGSVGGVPHGITQETVTAAAQKILQQTGLDKSEVSMPSSKPSTERVVFHNGAQGAVHLELSATELPGLAAKLERIDLNFGEDTVIQITYNPPRDAGGPVAVENVTPVVRLNVTPFNQLYEIKVHIGQAN